MGFLMPTPKVNTPPPPPDQALAKQLQGSTSQLRVNKASTLLTGDMGLPDLGSTSSPAATKGP